jgi:hypothetical protein
MVHSRIDLVTASKQSRATNGLEMEKQLETYIDIACVNPVAVYSRCRRKRMNDTEVSKTLMLPPHVLSGA